MLNMLYGLMNGKIYGKMKDFSKYFVNGKYTDFQELTKDCEEFYYNGQTIILYGKNREIKFDANTIGFCDCIFITTMYGKEGLVYDSKFSYDSDFSNCLYDIWKIKQDFPDRWIYKLESVYTEYGVDVVNHVRECCDLFSM